MKVPGRGASMVEIPFSVEAVDGEGNDVEVEIWNFKVCVNGEN